MKISLHTLPPLLGPSRARRLEPLRIPLAIGLTLSLVVGSLALPAASAVGPQPCYGVVSVDTCIRWLRQQAEILPPDAQEILDDLLRQIEHIAESTVNQVISAWCFVGGPDLPPAIVCPPQ